MTKKEIKNTFKAYMKTAGDNQTDIKTLNILNPPTPTCTQARLSQEHILKNVNLYTREKAFNLILKNGPFFSTYNHNGSNILLRNNKGYLASYNTQHLNLGFEENIEDTVYDATWLHNELYFAVAQETALFVYDNRGIELHAVRDVVNPKLLKFLPFHFLLAIATDTGKLKYLDTSIGNVVADIYVKEKIITSISSDPTTAVIHLGTRKGIVNLWAPSQKEYLAQINCHKCAVTNIEIEKNGHRMITTGLDNKIKIFDIRELYKPIKSIKTKSAVSCTALSQQDLLAIASGRDVAILRNFEDLYLKENVGCIVSSVEFSPFEDILSIGHSDGVKHMVVPGSGNQIYDSCENSPFMTVKQRQTMEVKRLLEKVPYDLISRESIIGHFDIPKPEVNVEKSKRYFETGTQITNALSRFNDNKKS